MTLNEILNKVALNELTTQDAGARIAAELRAARRPLWAYVVLLVLVLLPFSIVARGCVEGYVIKERADAAQRALVCPTPSCDFGAAKKRDANEMLRGLRLRCGSYALEDER